VAVMVNVPSDGTRSTAESASQAALHASRNARVSSVEPSPTAPYSRTSNTHGSSGCTGVAGSDGTMPVGGGRATGWVSSSGGGGNAGDDTRARASLSTAPVPGVTTPLRRLLVVVASSADAVTAERQRHQRHKEQPNCNPHGPAKALLQEIGDN
jgi:hypothetical protein